MEIWRIHPKDAAKLINRYSHFECLWNVYNKGYKDANLKKKAWRSLALEFNRDVSDIKKKIKYLRSAYVNEKRKVDDSKKMGATGDEVYRPKLFYYDDFNFLNNIIVLRKSVMNEMSFPEAQAEESKYIHAESMEEPAESYESADQLDQETEDSFGMEYVALPSPNPSLGSTIEEKHWKSETSVSSIHEEPEAETQDHTDHVANKELYVAFGKTVAMQLALLSPLEATTAMDAIHRHISKKIMSSMLARKKHEMEPINFRRIKRFRK